LEFSVSQTVGDFVVQRLHDWGVSHIFGYPGDGINGVFGALNRADGKIQFIQARHEEMAAFMAVGRLHRNFGPWRLPSHHGGCMMRCWITNPF
jgi:glyoxylate carboligase